MKTSTTWVSKNVKSRISSLLDKLPSDNTAHNNKPELKSSSDINLLSIISPKIIETVYKKTGLLIITPEELKLNNKHHLGFFVVTENISNENFDVAMSIISALDSNKSTTQDNNLFQKFLEFALLENDCKITNSRLQRIATYYSNRVNSVEFDKKSLETLNLSKEDIYPFATELHSIVKSHDTTKHINQKGKNRKEITILNKTQQEEAYVLLFLTKGLLIKIKPTNSPTIETLPPTNRNNVLKGKRLVIFCSFDSLNKINKIDDSAKECSNNLAAKSDDNNQTIRDHSADILPTRLIMEMDRIRSNNLPILRRSTLTSATAGSVELFWPESSIPDENFYEKISLEEELYAKDPWELVNADATVAIDFGTSSTVVIIKDEKGRLFPLRMGRYGQESKSSKDYENPTALEFTNINDFLKVWKNEPNRPLTDWNDVWGAFDATNQIKDHAASGLTNIKSWAKKRSYTKPLNLVDEKGNAFSLFPLDISKDEQVFDFGDFQNRDLDPIELYGYYLGLCLNNETVGEGSIYLNYILSYPVKFDKETKLRIFQGLKRGILRSLPASLIYSEKWKALTEDQEIFRFRPTVSEPIALAASTLTSLDGIKPNEYNRVDSAFCIFDFGGGTADFAAGFFRKASPEELQDYDKEYFIEIANTSGDAELGGEHIVDLIAYEVLRDNSIELQKKDISFIRPDGFDKFPGSEQLWHNGEESYGNFVQLREALRPIWENSSLASEIKTSGTINSIHLKNSNGKDIETTIAVNYERIVEVVKARLSKTIDSFFDFMVQSFKHYQEHKHIDKEYYNIQKYHIILSGNSCKSELFNELFDEASSNFIKTNQQDFIDEISDEDKNKDPKEFIEIRKDLIKNSTNTDELGKTQSVSSMLLQPNLKNSVALGLLILDSENIEYKEINIEETDEIVDQAPFDYFIGTFKDKILQPKLMRNAKYFEWVEFGRVKPTLHNDAPSIRLGWTNDASYKNNKVTIDDCRQRKISISKNYVNYKIFIRPIAPEQIQICFSKDDSVDNENPVGLQVISLD